MVQTDLHALDGARHLRTFGHERLADIEHRYGADHVVTRSVNQARPELERCIQQVEARMPSSAPP